MLSRAKIQILLLTLLLIGISPAFIAQDKPRSNKKAEKELVKQRKAKGKEARKMDKEAMKRHYDAQGKATRKRMRKSKKKSESINRNRRQPFWKKWFS